MTPKLTPWFPADVKPSRVGLYQRDYSDTHDENIAYCYWDGAKFGCGSSYPYTSLLGSASISQNLPWRGLASDPAVSK